MDGQWSGKRTEREMASDDDHGTITKPRKPRKYRATQPSANGGDIWWSRASFRREAVVIGLLSSAAVMEHPPGR
ncbi:unnamed protein product [Soboliphyme baturini]|uniref:Uncharacterized protein n=1 Tax=Soboliphyme baturini TaxID=241478 RepID=A0A183IUS8_9BILA|nr:unnamed protein product [Soboliphyme baturini]